MSILVMLQVTKVVIKEVKDSSDQTVSQSDTGKNHLLIQLKTINSNLVDVEVSYKYCYCNFVTNSVQTINMKYSTCRVPVIIVVVKQEMMVALRENHYLALWQFHVSIFSMPVGIFPHCYVPPFIDSLLFNFIF